MHESRTQQIVYALIRYTTLLRSQNLKRCQIERRKENESEISWISDYRGYVVDSTDRARGRREARCHSEDDRKSTLSGGGIFMGQRCFDLSGEGIPIQHQQIGRASCRERVRRPVG